VLWAGSALAKEPGTGSHTIIVLDSSRHMARSLAAAPSAGQPSLTRLAAARDAVSTLLETLASQERHTVTLVLFGHRVEPAQDVEIMRESRPLIQSDLASYETTLDALEPGGEAPVFLAIERAVELSQSDSGQGAQVIVLTSGQTEAAGSLDKEQLLEAIRATGSGVSIVQLGLGEQDARQDDLREIALTSGGLFYTPTSPRQVTEALRRVVTAQEPARIETALRLQPPPPPLPPGDDIIVPAYDVVFDVTYYDMPVKDAEVIIRGPNFDLVYDRELEYKLTELRASRLAGRYIFRAVPEDAVGYTVEITANVKNRTYKVVRGFSVDYDNKAPGRSFKIQLEKSKEPPPVPAAAP
jgi:Mg-chelatase subunit ChlD